MSSKIGSLRQRIILQELTRTSDGQGGFTSTWSDYATLWANITPLKAWEKNIAMQVMSSATHKILIRNYPDLISEMQIQYQDRTFQIKGIQKVNEENFYMELFVEEKGSGT